MSYLDRLKVKISQDAPNAGATKVSKGAFVPFVATLSAPLRQISAATIAPDAELLALVDTVAASHGFTLKQRAEAQQIAQADPAAALECFRAQAQRIRKPTGTDARRERLLAMLERDPEARYAVLTADDGKGPVIVAIAIRGAAMAEIEIDRDRYDGLLMLELLEKHTLH